MAGKIIKNRLRCMRYDISHKAGDPVIISASFIAGDRVPRNADELSEILGFIARYVMSDIDIVTAEKNLARCFYCGRLAGAESACLGCGHPL